MRKLIQFFVTISLVLSTSSCNKKYDTLQGIEIQSIKILKGIPSASGCEQVEERQYVIGDDSPWLFEINEKDEIMNKIPLLDSTFLQYKKIPKKIKPDFESIVLIDQSLYIFGSGSKQRRATLREVNLQTNKVKTYSLEDFYNTIMKLENIKLDLFNIEGSAVTASQLFLVNRENNALYEYSLEDFKKFISDGVIPVPKIRYYTLPAIQTIQSTFSGLDYNQQKDCLVFTASVEDNTDPINDGAILGSFIGEIKLSELEQSLLETFVLNKDNKILPIKAESVSVLKEGNYKIVTDSDGKGSKVLTLSIK